MFSWYECKVSVVGDLATLCTNITGILLYVWRARLSFDAVEYAHVCPVNEGNQSTRHIAKSCDELTVVFHGVVTS